MRIRVDFSRCCGNGLCASIAPEYFDLDQRGQLHIRDTEVDDDSVDAVEEALETCPAAAIRLEF
jgi:ferredoxin